MRRLPAPAREIKLQGPVFGGMMIKFADKTQNQFAASVPGNGKADSIAGAFARQPRTVRGVAQIALFQLLRQRLNALVAGSTTVAVPWTLQRQPRRMEPGAIFLQLLYRHEERASQWFEVLVFRMTGIVLYLATDDGN
jgi:hypothetical protein